MSSGLLEGFAFLAARVQLRLDAQFPAFTQHLLEIVYPHYLAPMPSMVVAQFDPLLTEGALATGYELPARTMLNTARKRDQAYGSPVSDWPCGHAVAPAVDRSPLLQQRRSPGHRRPRRFERNPRWHPAQPEGNRRRAFDQLPLDRLPVFLPGADDLAGRLYEQLVGNAVSVVVRPKGGAEQRQFALPKNCIRAMGFADDEALLPNGPRSFSGYRYLQEFFAFPKRFMFIELLGLRQALAQCPGTEIEIVVLLNRRDTALERNVEADRFALFCTPAINLVSKRTDRVQLNERDHEFHLLADRTRPLDYELWSVNEVRGFGSGTAPEVSFAPLYGHQQRQHSADKAYFMLRREPRMLSSRARQQGGRSGYLGSETFVSLVDQAEAPIRSSLRYIEAQTLCTNRDLPLLFSPSGRPLRFLTGQWWTH